jgi:Protein of unknown function (DUF4058)
MPMHDWTKVESGTYHAFHVRWISAVMDCLNDGLLPEGYSALPEQVIGKTVPDVITLLTPPRNPGPGGTMLMARPKPKAAFVFPALTDAQRYVEKANRIAVRHRHGDLVAVIELVSPGNKDGTEPLNKFVRKSIDLLKSGVNVMFVDPFPPGPRDPRGLHPLIWDEFVELPFELPEDKPLTMASYQTGEDATAYVEPIGVGDPLPTMPLFLEGDFYVNLPWETTYVQTWKAMPPVVKQLFE